MVKNTLFRLSKILRANVNEVLDHFEDPEKMVRQMVRDMEADVDRVAGAVGAAVAGRLRLERERDANRRRSEQLQGRAQQALEAGDEALARELLERRILIDAAGADLDSALTESETTAQRLKEQLTSLRSELEEVRRRQSSLIAQLQARRQPAPSVPPAHDPRAEVEQLEQRLRRNRGEFERLRERLELDDVATDAADDVRRELAGDDPVLDRRLADLDVRRRVDEELESLRGRTTPEVSR